MASENGVDGRGNGVGINEVVGDGVGSAWGRISIGSACANEELDQSNESWFGCVV
jgi:hypothetical protein